MIFNSRIAGFTLAELLIALGILGVIATFTIPKVLQAQQNQTYNANAKEIAAMVSGAFQAYKLQNSVSSATKVADLTPYMNYVSVGTQTVDMWYGNTNRTCDGATFGCLNLHNGGTLLYATTEDFVGSGSTNAVYFFFDPDGKQTDSTTNGPGKSVVFWLYYNGTLTTYGTARANTKYGSGTIQPTPAADPPWFSWN